MGAHTHFNLHFYCWYEIFLFLFFEVNFQTTFKYDCIVYEFISSMLLLRWNSNYMEILICFQCFLIKCYIGKLSCEI